MNAIKEWAFAVACTTILTAAAERLTESCGRATAMRWLLRLILLGQLLMPLNLLIDWLKGA